MKPAALLPLLLLLPLLAVAACATTAAEEAAPAGTAATPEQIVAARQAAFNLTAASFGSMRGAVESGADVKPLAFAARGLNRWAGALPGMFPPGTNLPSSRALPTVWSDRAGFERQASAFQSATAQLLAAAQAGDKTAFAAAYKATGAACGSCHTPYRAEEAR